MMSNSGNNESNKRLKTDFSADGTGSNFIGGVGPLARSSNDKNDGCAAAHHTTTDALSLSVDEMATVFGFLCWMEILPARVCKVSIMFSSLSWAFLCPIIRLNITYVLCHISQIEMEGGCYLRRRSFYI